MTCSDQGPEPDVGAPWMDSRDLRIYITGGEISPLIDGNKGALKNDSVDNRNGIVMVLFSRESCGCSQPNIY